MLDLRDINKLQIDSYITIAAINSPNIYLSSTYKCNFLGADNKQ